MIKTKALTGLAFGVLAITACAKSDEDVIIAACQNSADGASEAFCTCSYEQMENALPPEILAAIAEKIREGADTAQDAIAELPQAQQIQTLPVLPMLLNCVGTE
ncbi:MAG: hypothetical protein CMK09_15515 [Ponticaulis sp.]|nr:hypothetical protein [Ponticaulis sp.]